METRVILLEYTLGFVPAVGTIIIIIIIIITIIIIIIAKLKSF